MTSPSESSTPTGTGIPYLGIAQSNPGQNWYRHRDPTVRDFKNYQVLDRWVNLLTNTFFMLSAKKAGVATWVTMSGASSGVQTLIGDAGGAQSPLLGSISILGTASQVTVTGTVSTLTISLPTTLSLGSTAGAAGTTISVGTSNFLLQGAATSTMTIGTGLTTGTILIGGTAQTGVITLGSSSGINIVNVGTGAGATTVNVATGAVAAKTVNIGTGAIDNAITIGTVTGTAALTLRAGSGAITMTGATNLTGNFTLVAAGNKFNRTSVATIAAAGANSMGSVVLVGGTVTVATTSVTANSLIKIWRQSVGATGAAALGQLSVGTIVAATSFVINAWSAADATALQASDVSVIGWEIVN